MQKLPLITSRKLIEIKSIGGQSIFDFYRQVQRVLKSEYPGVGLENLFAEPVLNENKGEVSWFTQLPGKIISITELSNVEATKLIAQLADANSKIKKLISKLQGSGGQYSTGAIALQNMLVCPDLEQSLFSANGQIVLTQWGCIPYGTDPKNFDIVIQGQKIIARELPTVEELMAPSLSVIENNQVSSKSEAIGEESNIIGEESKKITETIDERVPETATVKTKRSFFPWRTVTLLAMLLFSLFSLPIYGHFGNQAELIRQLHSQIDSEWIKISNKSAVCFPAIQPSVTAQTPPTNLIQDPITSPLQIDNSTTNTPALPAPSLTSEEIHDRLNQESVTEGKNGNISLAWSGTADLDLIVKEPTGFVVDYTHRVSPSGAALDIDANGCANGSCTNMDRPVENISYNVNMPKGRYQVYVNLFTSKANKSSSASISFAVAVKIDNQSKIYNNLISLNDMICNPLCHSNSPLLVAEFEIH